LSKRDFYQLLLLAAIWGSSYIFVRIAAPSFGSAVLVFARVLFAGVLMLLYLTFIDKQPFMLLTRWRSFLLLGAVNAAIPFTLISNAVIDLNASTASILNSTTPLFTAIVASIWLKERLTLRKVAGLILGVFGVGVLVGYSPLPITSVTLWAVSQSLLAACCYGIGNVYTRVGFKSVNASHLNVGLQLGAAVVLSPIALTQVSNSQPTEQAIIAWLILSVLCTAFAYILYLTLIANIGPTRTSMTTFLIPLFSLLWGGVFLGEPVLRLNTLLGLGVILASVFLVMGVRLRE
jgi:drug/metabolite transporter (DMT)-like permease